MIMKIKLVNKNKISYIRKIIYNNKMMIYKLKLNNQIKKYRI